MKHLLITTLCAGLFSLKAQPETVTVQESWFTFDIPAENVDSIAYWENPEGDTPWLLVTAKASHAVHVYDARNGFLLKRVGGLGAFAGQFNRPNGIAVADDLMFVVERDNQRVQILKLPEFSPVISFGAESLIKPYGLWVQELGIDPSDPDSPRYRVYVTDNYEYAEGQRTADGAIPPIAELGERVRVYDIERDGDVLDAELSFSFGATEGAGTLQVVESIWGDPAHNQLFISEENPETGSSLKVYTLDGEFTGTVVGQDIFQFQSEGLAIDTERNWLIATDQGKTANYFHIFEVGTYQHLGTFEGTYTLNTDGVCLVTTPIGYHKGGIFFAIHNDRQVSALDWDTVVKQLSRP